MSQQISRQDLSKMNRIVIKVGTAVVMAPDGSIALERIGSLIEQISQLLHQDKEIILVTSGAVGLGQKKIYQQTVLSSTIRSTMKVSKNEFKDPRACASAEQSNLMALYEMLFSQKDVTCSQVLLTEDDFVTEKRTQYIKQTLNNLLQIKIVPILNENDVVTIRDTPVRDENDVIFWDNDSLACLVGKVMNADLIVMLTDVEGLYSKPPSSQERSEIVHTFIPGENYIFGEKSRMGRGGMEAKTEAAWKAVQSGVKSVVICSGFEKNALLRAVSGEKIGTLFVDNPSKDVSYGVLAKKVRAASIILRSMSNKERSSIMSFVADQIQKHQEDILAANKIDMEEANKENVEPALKSRLELTPSKMKTIVEGIRQISKSEPIGKVLKRTIVAEGLELTQITSPLGVLLVIFESRPDVLPQVAALSFLSGNGLLLKGGKEAKHSNRIFHQIIVDSIHSSSLQKLPKDLITLIESREAISDLLKMDQDIDLIIPRGSSQLVRHIQQNTRIPVMGHSEGICHMYVDIEGDINKAARLIVDSKCDYPSACNATETLLLHKDIPKDKMEFILKTLKDNGVVLYGGPKAKEYLNLPLVSSFKNEYGNKTLTVELIDNVSAAIQHINTYSSGHTGK